MSVEITGHIIGAVRKDTTYLRKFKMSKVAKKLINLVNRDAVSFRSAKLALKTWKAIKRIIPEMPPPIIEISEEISLIWYAEEHYEVEFIISDGVEVIFKDHLIDGILHIEDLDIENIQSEEGNLYERLQEFSS